MLLPLVAVLAAYMLGWTGYGWETWSARHPSERGGRRQFLYAGGFGLVAAGVPLLLLAVGTDLFVLALARDRVTAGVVVLLVVLALSPLLLVVCGVRAARGDAVAAGAGALLGLLAYVWLLGHGSGDWLAVTAPGLVAPLVVFAGLMRPGPVRVRSPHP